MFKKAMDFFQDKVVGHLVAFSENIIMQSIRNGMMVTMPFTIIGSLFLIAGSFPVGFIEKIISPYAPYINTGYTFTFGIVALVAVMAVSYSLARFLETNEINAAAVSLAAFLVLQMHSLETEEISFALSTDNFGVTGIFTAILVAVLVPYVIKYFEKRKIVIRLPQGVPSYVSNSFVTLIPATFIIISMWIIRVFLGFDVNAIVDYMLSPLVFGLSTLPGILILCFLILALWTCGLNGDSIFDGLYQPIVLTLLVANAQAVTNGEVPQNITAYGFFYFGFWMGGTGGTLALVLLMLRSRSKTYKSLSKICLPAGIFCINEPLTFGFPIIFNPLMMIPFIFTPLILLSATYVLMSMGIIGKPVVMIPWTTPPLINAFLVTGGDIKAVVWQAIEIVIAMFIYLPFFKVAEKQKIIEESMEPEEETN